MRWKIFNQKYFVVCCLLFVVVIGGLFRFYNLNWDEGHYFHPDERNIASSVSRIHFFDQLNPQFFAYGSFPIYFYRAVGEILTNLTNNNSWVLGWSEINLIGRGVSALFSTLTIILIFLLGRKVWNEKVALLASFFTAFAVSLIQTAHYGVTESLLVFWLILLGLLSLEIIQEPTMKNYLKIGIILGLAAATKISAISFLIIPITTHLLSRFKSWECHLKFLCLLCVAFLTFALFSPHVFLDQQKFSESMNYETGVATGKLKVVYTLQFAKTFPYLFQIKNFFWQVGPAVTLLGILGIIVLLILGLKTKNKNILIFLSFPLIYFLYAGSWYTKFLRYMVPVLPFLTIAASVLLFEIKKKWRLWGNILMAASILLTLFWALAFFSIYTRPQTRISASKWIYQNLPAGAKILTEHWDDGLPTNLPPNYPNQYKIEQLTIYEQDDQQKINYYAEKLSGVDYIIINSRRLYGTLMYLPEKYPLTSRYYQLLFSGQLGYTQIAEFSSYPSLLGLTINDDASEETFQVYDHPKVIIFKNTDKRSAESLKDTLYEKNYR